MYIILYYFIIYYIIIYHIIYHILYYILLLYNCNIYIYCNPKINRKVENLGMLETQLSASFWVFKGHLYDLWILKPWFVDPQILDPSSKDIPKKCCAESINGNNPFNNSLRAWTSQNINLNIYTYIYIIYIHVHIYI